MMTWRLPAPRPNEGGQGGACFPCIFALVGQGADSAAMGAHGRGRRGGRSAIEPGACARQACTAGREAPALSSRAVRPQVSGRGRVGQRVGPGFLSCKVKGQARWTKRPPALTICEDNVEAQGGETWPSPRPASLLFL